jgi:hypothetical protein
LDKLLNFGSRGHAAASSLKTGSQEPEAVGQLIMAKFPFVRRRRLRSAIAERDIARAERDRARAEWDTARAESDTARAERDLVLNALSQIIHSSAVPKLTPVAVCRKKTDWNHFLSSKELALMRKEDSEILSGHRFKKEWGIAGYSLVARQATIFKVDMLYGNCNGEEFIHNIRERLVCPLTELNNRQRLIASLLQLALFEQSKRISTVYLMEQVTPFFSWAKKAFPQTEVIGSEFLGDSVVPGQVIDGIRHENLQNLSFVNSSLDFVISNDVLEHVSAPRLAFTELARVMRDGSQALMTFPFFNDRDHSVRRAEFADGALKHHRQPVYHGNPLSSDGSLVFTDFGWDIFELVKDCGFRDMALEVYHSIPLGHLGPGLIFRLIR